MDPTLNPPAIVWEAVAGQEAKFTALRKRIRVLAGDVERYTFDLAEALCEAQETRCYLKWGFASLPEYASLELGLKSSRAHYLTRIARVCKECGVPRADYEPAGITNLRIITTLDPDSTYFNHETKQHEPMVDHIVQLIADGPELTSSEVEKEVQRLMGNVGPAARITRSYNTSQAAYDNTIQKALEAKRKQLGSKGRDGTGAAREYSDGDCFEYICIDWLNDPNNFIEETDESHVQIEEEDSESRQSGCGSESAVQPRERNEDNFEGQATSVSLGVPKETQDAFPIGQKRLSVPAED